MVKTARPNGLWRHFVKQSTERIRHQVGDASVICGLSGGVDKSVVAVLLHEAIGDSINLCLC